MLNSLGRRAQPDLLGKFFCAMAFQKDQSFQVRAGLGQRHSLAGLGKERGMCGLDNVCCCWTGKKIYFETRCN